MLEMLPSYGTLMQGRWNERETFEYRYATNVTDGLFGCIARLRRGLFIAGFAVTDAAMIAIDADADWIGPAAPSVLLSNPRFEKKH